MPPSALLVDIGNTCVGMAGWYAGRIHPARHLTIEQIEAEPAWLAQAWKDLPDASQRYIVVSSVSPPRLDQLMKLVAEHCEEADAIVIGRDIPAPIEANVPEPDRVGTDRLCSAAAAHRQAQCACVVASFGTALTVDMVSDDGIFMGGAILPGMSLAARALHQHTALLPEVQVANPEEVWGTDTVEAIKVGIVCGLRGALREIVERYAAHIGKWPVVVLTGGDAALLSETIDFANGVVPDLCLRGIALAFEKALTHATER
jgi:type III pantothenate kinase